MARLGGFFDGPVYPINLVAQNDTRANLPHYKLTDFSFPKNENKKITSLSKISFLITEQYIKIIKSASKNIDTNICQGIEISLMRSYNN